jgi:hypothetical protein
MTIHTHYRAIVEALQGRSHPLRNVPANRLDWSGTGTVLQLFERTSGKERARFIEAIGRVVEEHSLPPAAVAELINIASGLDLAQVEPQVRKLQTEAFAAQDDLKKAIANYLGLRRFNAAQTPIESEPRTANGFSGPAKAKPKRTAAHRKASRG